ncbi:NHLP bacteriocin system secretion protein [Acuticoccus kandeliae]|uniref:NHLP bacteriocin system secretion protein n=1 Tax=Acuticoccus kandeliae TaxID=2073160 RepID=UPI000D3E2367|nr:NHLP bacteriocin system secretion protein [Acuticoccus kandeliae]
MSSIDLGARRQMATPDQLNRAIRLTSPSAWLLLLVLAVCVAAIVAWSFLGRLDVYVNGPGILQLADGVNYDVNATADGTVKTIRVKLGDEVKEGDTMFEVDQLVLRARRDATAATLKSQQAEFDEYKRRSDAEVAQRRENVTQRTKSLNDDLTERKQDLKLLQEILTSQRDLLKRGLTTQPQVQAVFSDVVTVRQEIREIETELSSLTLDQVSFEDQVEKNQADLRISLLSTNGQLDDLNAQLKFGGAILAPSSGLVTEITTELEAVIAAGTQLATIESGGNALIVRGYLPIGKGKQVEPDMAAEISPTSVERDIYGSARGTVTDVSRLPLTAPALQNVLGNEALVNQLMVQGAPIEVVVALVPDASTESGFRWTSSAGPPIELTPGTTTDVRVLTERRRPISLVLPILQTWFDDN